MSEAEAGDRQNQEKKSIDDGAGKEKSEAKELTMTTAVFIGLAFAIGILVEDLSSKYRDSLLSLLEAYLNASFCGAFAPEVMRLLQRPNVRLLRTDHNRAPLRIDRRDVA